MHEAMAPYVPGMVADLTTRLQARAAVCRVQGAEQPGPRARKLYRRAMAFADSGASILKVIEHTRRELAASIAHLPDEATRSALRRRLSEALDGMYADADRTGKVTLRRAFGGQTIDDVDALIDALRFEIEAETAA